MSLKIIKLRWYNSKQHSDTERTPDVMTFGWDLCCFMETTQNPTFTTNRLANDHWGPIMVTLNMNHVCHFGDRRTSTCSHLFTSVVPADRQSFSLFDLQRHYFLFGPHINPHQLPDGGQHVLLQKKLKQVLWSVTTTNFSLHLISSSFQTLPVQPVQQLFCLSLQFFVMHIQTHNKGSERKPS